MPLKVETHQLSMAYLLSPFCYGVLNSGSVVIMAGVSGVFDVAVLVCNGAIWFIINYGYPCFHPMLAFKVDTVVVGGNDFIVAALHLLFLGMLDNRIGFLLFGYLLCLGVCCRLADCIPALSRSFFGGRALYDSCRALDFLPAHIRHGLLHFLPCHLGNINDFRDRLFYSAVPEDGAVDLLKYLSSKYTLCAASNGPYEQQINRLKIGEMDEYFTCCFISSQIGAQKPGRQFFDHCFRVLRETEYPDLAPEEVIIIGDSISSDISGGRDYGMHTCLYQKSENSERSDHGAEHVVKSLAEIKNIL